MGRKKSSIIEKIREGEKKGEEGLESGKELEGDGKKIKQLLDGINSDMDQEDVAFINDAKGGYNSDFQSTFKESSVGKMESMKESETEAIKEAEGEKKKVEDASDKFKEMTQITDVGSRGAETAAGGMEESANEYEQYQKNAESVIKETESEINSLKGSIDRLFG